MDTKAKKKPTGTKLLLKRETFRRLDAEVLEAVRGGEDECGDEIPTSCIVMGWTNCGGSHCGSGRLMD